jgi:hypothetical protein
MQTKHPGSGFQAFGPAKILTIAGHTKTIPYDDKSCLMIMYFLDGAISYMADNTNSQQENSGNLTRKQRLLLKWHHRLSDLSFSKMQDLAPTGKLPKSIVSCPHSICHSCQFGKAHRQPTVPPTTASPINFNDLKPGDKVSVDQIESTTTGFIDICKGKPTLAKHHKASAYVDYGSRLTYVKCHYLTGAAEEIEGKQ